MSCRRNGKSVSFNTNQNQDKEYLPDVKEKFAFQQNVSGIRSLRYEILEKSYNTL